MIAESKHWRHQQRNSSVVMYSLKNVIVLFKAQNKFDESFWRRNEENRNIRWVVSVNDMRVKWRENDCILGAKIKKTRLSVSGHGRLTRICFQLQWKMRFQKGGRYRRSEVERAPHYSNNSVRCGVEVCVEIICHSVGVEVICHSTFRSGYQF